MDELKSLVDLLDLQGVDSDIDRLAHQRRSLPELDQYRAAHAAIEATTAELAEQEERVRVVSLELDKAEGELELLEQKLAQHERRLFAGGLSAREAEAMQKDVESLRRQDGEMEEAVLMLLDRREELEAAAKETASRLEGDRAVCQELEAVIAGQWKVIDAEIARRESRKRDIAPLIPPDLLDLYEGLRRTKEGVGVGRLADGICGGCHLALSRAEQEEALREDPPRCLHCRRILVP